MSDSTYYLSIYTTSTCITILSVHLQSLYIFYTHALAFHASCMHGRPGDKGNTCTLSHTHAHIHVLRMFCKRYLVHQSV